MDTAELPVDRLLGACGEGASSKFRQNVCLSFISGKEKKSQKLEETDLEFDMSEILLTKILLS